MKTKHTFYMGLEYPNALFFGMMFIGITIYGIYHSLSAAMPTNQLVANLLFISVPLMLGLLSLSFKTIQVDLLTNKIIRGTHYCLIFSKNETYNLSDIKKIKIKQSKGNYTAGGRMLATAQQSFSVNETSIIFYSYESKSLFTLERVSTKSKLIQFLKNQLQIEFC
jgi:hypothetical protein